MRKLLLATPLVALAAACASAAGGNPVDRPDLVVPPPPAHVVPITPEPVSIEPVADVPASPSAPANRGAARGTREAPPKPAATETKPDTTKPETPPAEAPPAAPPATPPAAAPQLRTTESSGAEGAVRGAIERTRNLLNSIDYRLLTPTRRKYYDDAKGFAQQAEDALKAGNMVFAQSVATKAEALARELAGK